MTSAQLVHPCDPASNQHGAAQLAASSDAVTVCLRSKQGCSASMLPTLLPAKFVRAANSAAGPCCECRHATSIEEDEHLLSDASKLPPRLQAAVQARLERKRLLATAQQMLAHYASSLKLP